MIVAQITDTHIKRKGKLVHHMVNTARYLRRAVEQINGLRPRPDVVIATGDLTDEGKAKEYKRLRKLLAPLEIPMLAIPGNHDDRERFREAFADGDYLPEHGPVHYVAERYPVRLIAVDTTVPGQSGGSVSSDELAWLEARLREEPDRPTLIFMHHPPFRTGIKLMDGNGFGNADALGALVARYPCIERITCGHIHRSMQVRWRGTIACTAPSTAHQIVLELRVRVPLGLTLEPPGFLLHVWDGTGMVTHTCTIGDYKRGLIRVPG
jgi:3',5'-cyclic AMP phosphodiesterase CpdA